MWAKVKGEGKVVSVYTVKRCATDGPVKLGQLGVEGSNVTRAQRSSCELCTVYIRVSI